MTLTTPSHYLAISNLWQVIWAYDVLGQRTPKASRLLRVAKAAERAAAHSGAERGVSA